MRERLRAVECPKEIIDQIGGWSSSDVGESYGNGFPLDNIEKWLIKIINYQPLTSFEYATGDYTWSLN